MPHLLHLAAAARDDVGVTACASWLAAQAARHRTAGARRLLHLWSRQEAGQLQLTLKAKDWQRAAAAEWASPLMPRAAAEYPALRSSAGDARQPRGGASGLSRGLRTATCWSRGCVAPLLRLTALASP